MIAWMKEHKARTDVRERQRKQRRDAYAETYEDVEALIWHAVLNFNRRHGGDVEEQISIANLMFMEALERHEQDRSSFVTYLVWKIWWMLMKDLNKQIQRQAARPAIMQRWPHKRGALLEGAADDDGVFDINEITDRPDRTPFDAEMFMDAASEDAQQVLQMALEFEDELKQEARSKTRTLRSTLRNALCKLGWTMDRITESFGEIREALEQ